MRPQHECEASTGLARGLADSGAHGKRAHRHYILEEDLHAFMRPKQAREAFVFLDRDRSGRLTLREVNEAVSAVFQCAPPLTLHPGCLPPRTFQAGRIAWPEPVLHQAAHSSALVRHLSIKNHICS